MQPGRNKPFKDVEKVRFLLHTLDKENPKETSKLYKRCCAASVFVGFLICCRAAAGVSLHGKNIILRRTPKLVNFKISSYIYLLISGPTPPFLSYSFTKTLISLKLIASVFRDVSQTAQTFLLPLLKPSPPGSELLLSGFSFSLLNDEPSLA